MQSFRAEIGHPVVEDVPDPETKDPCVLFAFDEVALTGHSL